MKMKIKEIRSKDGKEIIECPRSVAGISPAYRMVALAHPYNTIHHAPQIELYSLDEYNFFNEDGNMVNLDPLID